KINEYLGELINNATQYYENKLSDSVKLLFVNCKDIYISYFLKVDYIPVENIPNTEDLHIHYDDRYIRECQWFTYEQMLNMNDTDFHKRLQISHIKKKLESYNNMWK